MCRGQQSWVSRTRSGWVSSGSLPDALQESGNPWAQAESPRAQGRFRRKHQEGPGAGVSSALALRVSVLSPGQLWVLLRASSVRGWAGLAEQQSGGAERHKQRGRLPTVRTTQGTPSSLLLLPPFPSSFLFSVQGTNHLPREAASSSSSHHKPARTATKLASPRGQALGCQVTQHVSQDS